MKRKNDLIYLSILWGLGGLAAAQPAGTVSEKDYLDDVPVVLSVSRLPQRLDETPGAVTIIDRQMIRMSGARDVADLLRLVPGFRVSNSFESNTPQGSYHTSLSDYSNHMQVMVDGRSVYSTYLQGSTGPGLQTVALEDIERIEVHRGSNSAAYGARAFLGTINIVTRDPVDTLGTQVQVAGGDNQILDGLARLGWGDDRANYRLTADQRSDRGLQGSSGPDRVSRVNFRGDMRLSPYDQIELRLGQSVIEAGIGFAGQEGNAPRTRSIDTGFLQLDWRRNLSVDQDLSVQASRTNEQIRDVFPYVSTSAPVPGLQIDASGRASADNLLLQHTLRVNSALRWVWGGELRRETITSRAQFDTDAAFVTDFTRVFGNAEWRLRRDLILNAGALVERSSIAGESVSPRAMLNWHAAEGQTLRYGMSRAHRPPSTFEKYANVRYYDPATGTLVGVTDVARGAVGSEVVESREIGYLGEFHPLGLSVDVRGFEESVRDFINKLNYNFPGVGQTCSSSSPDYPCARDYVNNQNFKIHGYEYQLKWKPWRDGQLIYSQAVLTSTQSVGAALVGTYGSQSLMFMQQLPAGYAFSLVYSEADASHFPGADQAAPAFSRTDLRLARALRLAGRRAEVSVVGQNLGGSYPDFIPGFRYQQQVYVMLRLEN